MTPTITPPVMVDGDALLFGLRVLSFFKRCGGYAGTFRGNHDEAETGGFSYDATYRTLRARMYGTLLDGFDLIASDIGITLLSPFETKTDLSQVMFDVSKLINHRVNPSGQTLPLTDTEHQALAFLYSFFEALAMGHIRKDDFYPKPPLPGEEDWD